MLYSALNENPCYFARTAKVLTRLGISDQNLCWSLEHSGRCQVSSESLLAARNILFRLLGRCPVCSESLLAARNNVFGFARQLPSLFRIIAGR